MRLDWPIGLSTGCFYQTSIFDCLEEVRDAGFTCLEICSFPAHLNYHDVPAVSRAASQIKQLGLVPFSFHAPFAEHIDITALDASGRKLAFEELSRAADAAAKLGVRNFVVHPGPEVSQRPQRERGQRLRNATGTLAELARRCDQLGVGLVLENMLPHLFLGSCDDILSILDELSGCDLGVCLDTGHAYLSGRLGTDLRRLAPHLRMVHASDNRGKRDDHLPPGEGDIGWRDLISQLADVDFGGALILEIAGSEGRQRTLKRAQRSRRFLEELCRDDRRPRSR